MSSTPTSQARLRLTLRKPRLAAYGGVRPTVVVEGRGHPAQWGNGTWSMPGSAPATLSVFLFNRLWRFGYAQIDVDPEHPDDLEYVAPWLPFLPGRLRSATGPGSS